jgi:hypothetical protein
MAPFSLLCRTTVPWTFVDFQLSIFILQVAVKFGITYSRLRVLRQSTLSSEPIRGKAKNIKLLLRRVVDDSSKLLKAKEAAEDSKERKIVKNLLAKTATTQVINSFWYPTCGRFLAAGSNDHFVVVGRFHF